MIQINISNHPELPEIKRKATWDALIINNKMSELFCDVRISHYNSEGVELETMKAPRKRLHGTNSHHVTAQGDLIPEDSPDWETGIPEFYFLTNIPAIEGTIFNSIENIVIQYITKRDEQGFFGKGIY